MNYFPLSLLTIIIFVLLTVTECRNCPPNDIIAPCSCFTTAYDTGFVECKNFHTAEDLPRVVKNFKGYNVAYFALKDSSVPYFPKNIFQYAHFKSFIFTDDTFNTLFDAVPEYQGIERVAFLRVKFLRGFDWTLFSAFTRLDYMEIGHVKLTGLSNFSKSVSRNLKEIFFYVCDLRKLRKDEFQNLSGLEKISIHYDSIKELKRSMFPRPAKIVLMTFDYNQISTLPEDLFEDMRIETVSFRNNRLTVLSEDTFKSALHAELTFDGNLLVCDCGMKWIMSVQKRHGTCDSPFPVKDRHLEDLKSQDFELCQNTIL